MINLEHLTQRLSLPTGHKILVLSINSQDKMLRLIIGNRNNEEYSLETKYDFNKDYYQQIQEEIEKQFPEIFI